MRVHLIRTHHPHWGQYSGAHQFIRHLDSDKFRIDVHAIAMGDDEFPIQSRLLRNGIKYLVRRKGLKAYCLNDLLAEIDAGREWWRGQVDILHYLEGEHSLQYLPSWLRRLQALKPRPPIVVTFHQPPELLDSLINPGIVQLVDRVIVLSPEQHSYFETYMPDHQISMILHGVDTDFFHPASKPKAHGVFRCLSVGSWLRDYKVVLRVAELLRSQHDLEFQIVSSTISAPPHLPSVSVRSGIDDDALRTMYQQADVLFLPVKAATANNSILEGIASGLPVVATDLPSLRTYLPGKEAMLIPHNDPERFARALLTLYHDPELRREMAVQARRRALELSWSNAAREHETLYHEVALQASQDGIPGEKVCT